MITLGFDVSPLYTSHQSRGIGFYTKRLLEVLKRQTNIQVVELKNKNEIKKGHFDILHIPYFSPFFITLPLVKKSPLVVTIHDLIPVKYPNFYPPGIKGKLKWEIQKNLLKQVDALITDSQASKKDIIRLTNYPKNKIHVIYLAAGKEFKPLYDRGSQYVSKSYRFQKKFKLLAKIKKQYRLPTTFVLYVGDINWNKNIPSLVKACEKAAAPLVIVGKQAVNKGVDPDHPENRDLIWLQRKVKRTKFLNHKNSKAFMLLGFVPTRDLVTILNLATVYCQPSFDEGFGLPVLEAMSCGCPVITSNRGSLPEVVGKAGVIVEPKVENLAKAIKKVIDDKKLAYRLTKKGLERARKFSWEKTAVKTIKVYQSLLDFRC